MIVYACGRFVLGHGASAVLWMPHIERASNVAVELDLACVTDIDAAGLGVLAGFFRRAARNGLRISVVAASDVVNRVATLTRLDQAIPGTWNTRWATVGSERLLRIDEDPAARSTSARWGAGPVTVMCRERSLGLACT